MSGRRAGSARGVLLLVFLILTLVIINGSNWFVLSRVRGSLERELGLRLVTVATSAVSAATPDLLLAPDVASDRFVRRTLEEISLRHDLDDIFLLDPDGNLLFALAGEESLGDAILGADPAPLARAAAGVASASTTIRVEGTDRQAGYAPVEDWDGTTEAVLAVTASGGFLATWPALSRTLTAISIGSAVLVAGLAAFFFGMSRRLATTEAALARNEVLTSMGMMAAGVAHEIRNPLAIISGTAERLKRKFGAGSDDPLFEYIPEEVERLNGIVESYLRFARDESPVLAPADLAALAERSVRLAREELGRGGVEILVSGTESPAAVDVDAPRFHQVMLNLLLNAAQAMPDGGRIDVTLTREAGRARLAVKDQGSGFSEEALRVGFEPFFTTKEQGSGLGLTMVRRIVEAHAGFVTLANDPAGGAIVAIDLPMRRDAEENP
ncbi:MAG: hypothetical protein KC591_10840 [Gemmatimonadetes bacterium]|nr:hypothetical protein [Gemmatimonadota bacterium]